MDFNGKGVIHEEDFFRTLLIYRLPFSKEDIQAFFANEKVFQQRPEGGLDFELFKKIFFPYRDLNGGMTIHDDTAERLRQDEILNTKDDKK